MIKSTLEVRTRGIGFYELTAEVARFVTRSGVAEGLVHLFLRHTSASLLIQENADPRVQSDLLEFFARLAPEDYPYAHDDEGPDDMPSHIRSAVTRSSETIPFEAGRLLLGTWQGLYLIEHRRAPQRRTIEMRVIAG